MNVRFSERALRCRTTREELDRLLSGRAVALELALPGDHIFRINVRPTSLKDWRLDTDPTGIWLTIPLAELESLSQAPPSKEGLTRSFPVTNGDSISVSFEVDVRKQGA